MLNLADQEHRATVVAFRKPCDDAIGRNRRLAAKAIGARLRKLSSTARYGTIGAWPSVDLSVGALNVFLSKTRHGLYFGIHHPDDRRPQMTGYIDPIRPGNYPELGMHVMSWRRGWERELFAS